MIITGTHTFAQTHTSEDRWGLRTRGNLCFMISAVSCPRERSGYREQEDVFAFLHLSVGGLRRRSCFHPSVTHTQDRLKNKHKTSVQQQQQQMCDCRDPKVYFATDYFCRTTSSAFLCVCENKGKRRVNKNLRSSRPYFCRCVCSYVL